MKRSSINLIIDKSIAFLNDKIFFLPCWGYWTLENWLAHKEQCNTIFDTKLGWDITHSCNQKAQEELVLFTIRNGILGDANRQYCEKIIIMESNQIIPYHYHKSKVEDIINRSEYPIGFKIGYERKNNTSKIEVLIDGITYSCPSEAEIILNPGQSLTLYPYYYHMFYPLSEKVLIGEVSTTNDDVHDNFFIDESTNRFPKIIEDEPIKYPLVSDYENIF